MRLTLDQLSKAGVDPKLGDLIRRAIAEYSAMTPEQKRAHRAAQRKSWVVGETMLAHPEMSREEAEALYDSVI
jgi:hypothetical protein